MCFVKKNIKKKHNCIFGLIYLPKIYFMKKIFTYLLSFGLPLMSFSQAFTPGNLVVVRIGLGGTTTLPGSGTISVPVFLDEYTYNPLTGITTPGLSHPIPYLASQTTGNNRQLTSSCSSSNDGMLTVSANGAYFTLSGYAADTGIGTIPTKPGIRKVIARVSMSGDINTTTVLDTTTSNARAVVTNDGTGFWAAANNKGVRYVPFGNTIDSLQTIVSKTVTNLRSIQTFGGNLVIGTASGTSRINYINGFPTDTGHAMIPYQGVLPTIAANCIYMTSLPATGLAAGVINTIYVADDGNGGIKKFSLNATSGSWDSTGILDAGKVYRGLTGITNGSNVVLAGVYNNNTLNNFIDPNGYNVAFTAIDTARKIVKAATNTKFRGVALVPIVTPVELIIFNAAKTEAGNAKVWWVVGSEVNMDKYVVEKSIDGKEFKEVSTIKAKGVNNYDFTDSKIIDVITYYRVKFVNNNGTFSYTNVVAVTPKKSIKLDVFPNPVKSNLVVSYPKTTTTSRIKITSLDGKILANQAVQEGSTQTSMDVSKLISGSYIVVFNDIDGNITSHTFVK